MQTDVAELAKQKIILARTPFDSALDAIGQVEKNREQIIRVLIEILKYLNPEWETTEHVEELLKSGKFPSIVFWKSQLDLRTNGSLTESGSFVKFLQDNMKEV